MDVRLKQVLNLLTPKMSIESITRLGEGWDSITFLLNESQVLRIPKRTQTAQQMLYEMRVLHVIHQQTELAVPDIKVVGPAVHELPVSFLVYPLIVGSPVGSSLYSDNSLLHQVGNFVTALHSIPFDILIKSNLQWFRWTGVSQDDSKDWETGLRSFSNKILEIVCPKLDGGIRQKVRNHLLWFLSRKEHFKFQPVLIHGDLSPEHILVNQGHLSGIIDFGDSGIGDPAYDVCSELLPFYKGQIDETFSSRQQFYRTLPPFHKALFGLDIRDERMVSVALEEISEMMLSLDEKAV